MINTLWCLTFVFEFNVHVQQYACFCFCVFVFHFSLNDFGRSRGYDFVAAHKQSVVVVCLILQQYAEVLTRKCTTI